jgi:hypothetical protein
MRISWHPAGMAAVAMAMVFGANPTPALAQGLGYISGGPVLVRGIGNHNFAWQTGAGGELGAGAVGLGGGFDYIYFTEVNKTFDNGRGSASSPAAGIPAFSLRASGYVGRAKHDRRLQPFVSGTITFPFAKETPPLLTAGGGLEWWATRKTGLRLEAGMQYLSVAFRCGLVFR